MRKKIVLLAVSLMMFMGVVSASSINGEYKGNPIVKVLSNGKQLQTDEVPAMIYDGHTVVPISLLRQLGASVEWNQNDYSVDVKLPQGSAATTGIPDLKKLRSYLADEVSFIKYEIADDGLTQLAFYLKFNLNDNSQLSKYGKVVDTGIDIDVQLIRLEDQSLNGSVYFIKPQNIRDFKKNLITSEEFNKRIEIISKNGGQQNSNNQPIQQQPQTTQPIIQPQQSNNVQLSDQYVILNNYYTQLQNSIDFISNFINITDTYFLQWHENQSIKMSDNQLYEEMKKVFNKAVEIESKGNEVYPKIPNINLTQTNEVIKEIYSLIDLANNSYTGIMTWKVSRFDTKNDQYGANLSVAKDHFDMYKRQSQELRTKAAQIKSKIDQIKQMR